MRIVQWILLVTVSVIIDSGYAQSDENNKCSSNLQFQCTNGQCIDGTLLCDGTANCIDSSDESLIKCEKFQCPSFGFRCSYGACIDRDNMCNGIQDCVDNSDEMHPECINNTTKPENNCNRHEFQCKNGQCISVTDVCDGFANCQDISDETSDLCESVNCNIANFRCTYGACIDGDLKCNGKIECVDGSDENSTLCKFDWPTPGIRPPNTTQMSIPSALYPFPRPNTSCRIPPQPENGFWKLHSSQCPGTEHCNVPLGTKELGLGSRLIYSCNSGYKITHGLVDVTCIFGGQWLNIPFCEEIRCTPLNSPSIRAECMYDDDYVSCRVPVTPMTRAEVECANSYHPESNTIFGRKQNVRCNTKGQWVPDIIKCVPGPLSINIYINNTQITFHTTFDQNNPTFIEVLNDRIIIHTNTNNLNYQNVNVSIPKSTKNITDHTNKP